MQKKIIFKYIYKFFWTFSAEGELDEIEEEDEMLIGMEVEQAEPVIPIPAPVEPPVKRKRGRPPKIKPAGEFLNGRNLQRLFKPKKNVAGLKLGE